MIENIGFTTVSDPLWIGRCAGKRLVLVGQAVEASGHLQSPKQNRTGGWVNATARKSGVDVNGRVMNSGGVGEGNRGQRGIAAAHSGHAAKAEAGYKVMAAVRASGDGCALAAKAGVEDVFANRNDESGTGSAHDRYLYSRASKQNTNLKVGTKMRKGPRKNRQTAKRR